MKGSATIDARLNACPRCSGTLIKDLDGDSECLQCGFVAYARPQTYIPAKRERPPSYKGMNLS